MNYIKEINAFYDHMERNPLSASAVTLWHTLMHINNKARWVKTFTVAAPVIRLKSGLKESSFKRARTELKEKGYIDYQSRSRNQAPVYRMVRLSGEAEVLEDNDTEHIGSGSAVACSTGVDVSQQQDSESELPINRATGRSTDEGADHLADQDASPLIKQKENKKKQDNTITADSAIAFFEENFGVAGPYVNRELSHWVNNIGEQLVLHAMKRALDRGKTSWGYVRAILESWREKGIHSVKEADEEEIRYRKKSLSRKGLGSNGDRVGREEVVPVWFWERKSKEKSERKQKEVHHNTKQETEEVQRMLAKMG